MARVSIFSIAINPKKTAVFAARKHKILANVQQFVVEVECAIPTTEAERLGQLVCDVAFLTAPERTNYITEVIPDCDCYYHDQNIHKFLREFYKKDLQQTMMLDNNIKMWIKTLNNELKKAKYGPQR